MTDTNRPQLWRAMDDAMDAQANREVGQTDPLVWRRIRAAEIRAMRDWLVPEEAPPLGPAGKERMAIRALLTAEADRAERGGAQGLIDAYEGAVGSTGPGANPASIAAVLSKLVADHTTCHKSSPEPFIRVADVISLIQELK